jgi:hypothetical protein
MAGISGKIAGLGAFASGLDFIPRFFPRFVSLILLCGDCEADRLDIPDPDPPNITALDAGFIAAEADFRLVENKCDPLIA